MTVQLKKENHELMTMTMAIVYEITDLYRQFLNHGELSDDQIDQLLANRLTVQKRCTRWASIADPVMEPDQYRVATTIGGPNVWIEYTLNYATNHLDNVRVVGDWWGDSYIADKDLTTREKAALMWAFDYLVDCY